MNKHLDLRYCCTIKIKCLKICSTDCKEIHFEKYIKFYNIVDESSTTMKINITPIKRLQIEYLESYLKMMHRNNQ